MSNNQNNKPNTPNTPVQTPPAATDNVAATVAESAFKIGAKETIRAVHGDLLHPYTDVRFTTTDEKRVQVDGWVKAQGDAGKLAIVAD